MRNKGISWDDEPLGEVTDLSLAIKHGVSSETVRQARFRRGIDKYEESHIVNGDTQPRRLKRCLEFGETLALRREGCSKYNECLSVAAMSRMKSFSCAGCKDYDPHVVMVDRVSDEMIYPKVEDKFNIKAFGEDVLDAMRKNGIHTKGKGIGNSDWRENQRQNEIQE